MAAYVTSAELEKYPAAPRVQRAMPKTRSEEIRRQRRSPAAIMGFEIADFVTAVFRHDQRPGHGRRQLLWFEVTRHPTAEWLVRQITEAFPWASAPAYLVRDNDGAYGHVFTSRVRAMGIRDRPISSGSPWQNGCAERLIGTVRRECLDRMLIFGESHL